MKYVGYDCKTSTSLRLRFVVVRRVFSLHYPILTLFSLLQIPRMVVFPIDKEPLVCGRVVSEWGFFLSPRSVSLAPISHPRPVRLLGAFSWSPALSISANPNITLLHALA